ncbi:hypothetical protein HDU79_004002 [Rhizoclosmatium sp. JEL0117]|nr:hypothetical protein HDU79_004002 [Rhizoclosmatium sp. JEL0117]
MLLEAVAAKCLELGAHTVVVEAVDVTVEQDLKLAIHKAGDRFGCIDLLVLNAGIGMAQNVRECSDLSFFRQITELNYLSVVSAVIYALPFVKAASQGKIVVISSILGFTSAPSASGYCASKYALKGFIDSLRMEEPSIDITMIYPGMVDTGIFDKIAGNKVGPNNTLSQVISTKDAISLIVNAVNRGARDEVFSLEGNFGWFMKPFTPRLLDLITTLRFQASLKRKNQ